MRISDWSSDVCSSDLRPTTRISPAAAYDQALERLGESIADLGRSLPHGLGPAQDLAELPEPVSNMTREQYHAAVERAKEYIRRSEEHTSELQSLMRISYAVFCLT